MILVIGAGAAGLACALAAVEAGAEVEVVTAGRLLGGADAVAGGSTALAQGGIAAAIGAGDRPALHAADTVSAGGGLVDAEAVALLAREGADEMRALLAAGFAADRDALGRPALGLEAAHGRPRIVHAGEDRSGAALHAFLVGRVLAAVADGRVRLCEGLTAVELLGDDEAVTGALLRDGDGALSARAADAVVLATGGYAGLYPVTSNDRAARGQGVLLAARAGALLADLEFVQFHPTVLVDLDRPAAAGRGFLVSEAVRGAGAVLRDGAGRRFMPEQHLAAELAPRDAVSRSIHRVLRERGERAVWLDATGIEGARAGALARRFPSITAATRALGFDWAREPVPVAPAAHYTMGGVATDLDGRTSVRGLFAAGEVAATGVHGANRLASNSLLEGLVFGARAGRAAAARALAGREREWRHRGAGFAELLRGPAGPMLPGGGFGVGAVAGAGGVAGAGAGARGAGPRGLASEICRMSEDFGEIPPTYGRSPTYEKGGIEPARRGAGFEPGDADPVAAAIGAELGIERDAEGLGRAAAVFAAHPHDPRATLGALIAASAALRTESRGAHFRTDFPDADPAQARRRPGRMAAPERQCSQPGMSSQPGPSSQPGSSSQSWPSSQPEAESTTPRAGASRAAAPGSGADSGGIPRTTAARTGVSPPAKRGSRAQRPVETAAAPTATRGDPC